MPRKARPPKPVPELRRSSSYQEMLEHFWADVLESSRIFREEDPEKGKRAAVEAALGLIFDIAPDQHSARAPFVALAQELHTRGTGGRHPWCVWEAKATVAAALDVIMGLGADVLGGIEPPEERAARVIARIVDRQKPRIDLGSNPNVPTWVTVRSSRTEFLKAEFLKKGGDHKARDLFDYKRGEWRKGLESLDAPPEVKVRAALQLLERVLSTSKGG